ncbi:MAG: hypothetical protein ACR2QF_13090 [Geminicoccaceae bacterium]
MNANPTEKRSSLADLARDFVGIDDEDPAAAPRQPAATATEIELALDDLISDDNGEIVFFNDSGFRTLSIATRSSVISDGQASDHLTAAGEDVSGFNYVTFDNGLTLYFEEGLNLSLSQS